VVGGIGLLLLQPAEGAASVGSTFDRLGSFSGTLSGDVSGRKDIWKASAHLIQDRPWFDDQVGSSTVVRHLFGYGPDLFLYVYPLEALLTHSEKIRLVKDAHNLWVNAAVETGVISALFLLLSAAIPGLGGAYFIIFRWRQWPLAYRLLAIALVASIAGHAVEQLVGVSQVSDAIISWALVGLLVALPRVVEGQAPAPLPTQALAPMALKTTVAAVATIVVLASVVTGWTHTMGIVVGSRDAAVSLSATRDHNDPLRAMELMASALDVAPESSAYRVRQAQLFEAFRLRAGTAVDDERLILGSLSIAEDGLAYNPLSLALNIERGEALLRLVRADDTTRVEEAAEAFERAGHLFPTSREANRTVGVRLNDLGLFSRALPWIEATITYSTSPVETQDGLFLMATSIAGLGRFEESIEIMEAGFDAQPSGPLAPLLRSRIDALTQALANPTP
jgi:hypothetical protein